MINKWLMLLTVLILITIAIMFCRSFENNIPTCNGYVINVYLYMLLGLFVICFSMLFIAKRRYPLTLTKSLGVFAITAIMVYLLMIVNPQKILLNHLVWMLILIGLSIPLYSIWQYTSYGSSIPSLMIGLSVAFLSLTVIAFINQEFLNMLLLPILAVIITISVFISGKELSLLYKLITIALILLITGLILYNNYKLRIKASKCIFPDYPNSSLGFILDLFKEISLN